MEFAGQKPEIGSAVFIRQRNYIVEDVAFPMVIAQAKEPLALTSKVELIRDEFQNFVMGKFDYTNWNQAMQPRTIRKRRSDFPGFSASPLLAVARKFESHFLLSKCFEIVQQAFLH